MPHDAASVLYLSLNVNTTAVGVEPIDQLQALYNTWSADHDGDFNNDGTYDCTDVDSLVAAIAAGSNAPAFDLNRDQLVDQIDLQRWLREAGAVNLLSGAPYTAGDATLDGVVDGHDFQQWNRNVFSLLPSWCGGDFTADGAIDGQDFSVWNESRSGMARNTSSVPEPAVLSLIVAVLFVQRREQDAPRELPDARSSGCFALDYPVCPFRARTKRKI
jgi:hypothetical protein